MNSDYSQSLYSVLDLHLLKQIISHLHLWLNLSPLHIRAWPFIKYDFPRHNSFHNYYLLILVNSIFSFSIQPPFLHLRCLSHQIHNSDLHSVLVFLNFVESGQMDQTLGG